jgi:hypothetical protein
MKSRTLTCITTIITMTLFAALAAPIQLAAQEQQKNKPRTRYKLIDLGTFGGPASYFSNGADGILNNRGTAAGWADTSTPDPYPAFCYNADCFVSHAFQSQNGVLTDLGVLPGGASSSAFWITPNGLILGNSENGQIDHTKGRCAVETLTLDGIANGIGMNVEFTGNGADLPMLGVKVAANLRAGFRTNHELLTSLVECVERDRRGVQCGRRSGSAAVKQAVLRPNTAAPEDFLAHRQVHIRMMPGM